MTRIYRHGQNVSTAGNTDFGIRYWTFDIRYCSTKESVFVNLAGFLFHLNLGH